MVGGCWEESFGERPGLNNGSWTNIPGGRKVHGVYRPQRNYESEFTQLGGKKAKAAGNSNGGNRSMLMRNIFIKCRIKKKKGKQGGWGGGKGSPDCLRKGTNIAERGGQRNIQNWLTHGTDSMRGGLKGIGLLR